MTSILLAADAEIVDFHKKVAEFAFSVNSKASVNDSDYPFAGGALHSIGTEALALHGAVFSLCASGWAFATLILLRTMLELMASTLVIHKAETDIPAQHPDHLGFKYLFSWARERRDDSSISGQERQNVRAEIERALSKLREIHPTLEERGRASIFSEKLRGFWWNPEYKGGPMDIFQGYWPEPDKLYATLSSASHGGLTGLRLFKDDPEEVHPNPRKDPASQNAALTFSCRLLLEMCGVRGDFEKCDTNKEFLKLHEEFLQLRATVEDEGTPPTG